MDERHTYRAHRVDLVLLETVRGRYRWIAFIDGEHMSVGPEALTSLVAARQEALRLANLMIDKLEASSPPRLRAPAAAPAPSSQPVGATLVPVA